MTITLYPCHPSRLVPWMTTSYSGPISTATPGVPTAPIPPEFYYRYGRTVAFLDVCALTEHDTISQALWQELAAIADRFNEPHHYTTFLGYEWTGDLVQSLNVLFKAEAGNYYPAGAAGSQHWAEFVALLASDGDALLMRHDLPGWAGTGR
ncbi:MAG: DUF3604 domain-containing protein [Caldilineaceae bacterium]